VQHRAGFVKEQRMRAMQTGVELQAVRKDGHVFPADIALSPIRGEEGNYMMVTVRDITERKKARHELEALTLQLQLSNDELEEKVKSRTEEIKYSEIQYRNLFENTPMPMWIFDRQSFAFLDVNKQACSLYGYSKEEFLQMTVLDIRTPEEQERFLQSAFIKDIHLNESDTSIWTHVKKNGTSFQVEVHAHSVLYKGKSARLVLLNDVSERIKSEEKIMKSVSVH
jgi:PAS domain S-box-containing protein